MNQVDFHLLASDDPKEINKRICLLAEQYYKEKRSVYLYCNTKEQAQIFNELLWTFKDLSFIPHQWITESQSFKIPMVYVGFLNIPEAKNTFEVIINLTEEPYEFSESILKIVELVPKKPDARVTSRSKYKHYQTRGYTVNTPV